MTDSYLLDASAGPLAGEDLNDGWTDALRRAPWVVRYGVALLMVGVAVGLGFGLKPLVTTPNLTLIFVLPVVVAATTFGWGPALAAVVAGVFAFDYFFTEPYFQLTIASATDFWAAMLLLVVAAIVSAVAGLAHRRAETARRAARQATALQVLAHTVIEGRPQREIAQAAGLILGQLFGAPCSIFKEGAGGVELVATSAGATITLEDEGAALGAVTLHLPVRARSYPFEEFSVRLLARADLLSGGVRARGGLQSGSRWASSPPRTARRNCRRVAGGRRGRSLNRLWVAGVPCLPQEGPLSYWWAKVRCGRDANIGFNPTLPVWTSGSWHVANGEDRPRAGLCGLHVAGVS